jgi:hypothetical protein
MTKLSFSPCQIENLDHQLHRLNGILGVVIHLFPESPERFEYDDEMLILISVARDLAQDMLDQCNEGTSLASVRDYLPQFTTQDAR